MSSTDDGCIGDVSDTEEIGSGHSSIDEGCVDSDGGDILFSDDEFDYSDGDEFEDDRDMLLSPTDSFLTLSYAEICVSAKAVCSVNYR